MQLCDILRRNILLVTATPHSPDVPKSVFFDFDHDTLNAGGKSMAEPSAQFLQCHPAAQVTHL